MLVQSVDRALEILAILSASNGQGHGITEIAARMGLSKSTVHGLVNTLASRGYVEQNRETKRYRLGIKLFELGSLVQRSMDVRLEARPYSQVLSDRYQATVHVAVSHDYEVVYIDKLDSPDAIVQYSYVGRRAPLYATGVGKVILANVLLEEQEAFFQKIPLRSVTANTITSRQELEKELEHIRKCGYALDNEEIQVGLRCVAAPIFNHKGYPMAAISVSKHLNTMSSDMQVQIAQDIVDVARQISCKFGYRIEK